MSNTINIGSAAPDFELYDSNKQKHKLSDYRGKNVLLLFFPLAFTSVCTAELCDIRDQLKIYEGVEAVPLGISVDSLYTLAKFREENNLNFALLKFFQNARSRK